MSMSAERRALPPTGRLQVKQRFGLLVHGARDPKSVNA